MPRNKLSDLRNHLFETLERLKDEENPMDIGRAKAIANVSQVIINSATVEVKYMEASGAREPLGDFYEDQPRAALPGKVSTISRPA